MDQVKEDLIKNFGLSEGLLIEKIDAGFLSKNYRVLSGGKNYFLKGYRKGLERNRDIHLAKRYFASHGIPVILPLTTKTGDSLFTSGEITYALFPFVNGIHHNRQFISDPINIEIAKLLAKLHLITSKDPITIPAAIKFWSDEDSIEKIDELLSIISKVENKGKFDLIAEESLTLKRKLILRDAILAEKLDVEPHILIHGDFHEQNLFFDREGKISYVFDFGEVKMSPRAPEIWRSAEFMFLNGIFTEENIRKVILYLKTYNSFNPISRSALEAGFNIYYQMLIHSTWVETEHYKFGNYKVDHFIEKGTLRYFAGQKDAFLKRIFDSVYTN